MEYTGEIITQEESERRMIEDYKDNNVSGRFISFFLFQRIAANVIIIYEELLSHALSSEHDPRCY